MHLDGFRPMTETEMRKILTPHEMCRWRQSSVRADSFQPSQDSIPAHPNATREHALQVAFSDAIGNGCPPDPFDALDSAVGYPYNCTLGRYPHSCAWQRGLPLHQRSGLVSVFPQLLSESHQSHLLVALHALRQTNRSLTFIGDSTAQIAAAAAKCTAARFGTRELAVYAQRHVHFVESNFLAELQLRKMLQQLRTGPCAVVVVSAGMHFNQRKRSLYNRRLATTLPLLDDFASRQGCVAIWRSTIIPHFSNVNDQDLRARPQFNGTYQCVDSAAQATRRGTACWRESDVGAAIDRLRLRKLLVARLWRAGAPMYDTHVGDRVKEDGISKSDCLHDCPEPYLYEVLWWSLREATVEAFSM